MQQVLFDSRCSEPVGAAVKPGKSGLGRLFDAAGYSIKGIRAAWRNEAAFRQEVALC